MYLSMWLMYKWNEWKQWYKGQRKDKYFVIIRHLHYQWSGVVLLECGFGLVVNVYCRQKGNHTQKIFLSITQMLRKEKKLNHIRCSI